MRIWVYVVPLVLLASIANLPAALAGDLYVSPGGKDGAPGTIGSPLKSIQIALDRVRPGDTIHLAPGRYRVSHLTTRIAGAANALITIAGTDNAADPRRRYKTVVSGTSHVIDIDHSYYRLQGFALEGQEALQAAYRAANPLGTQGYPDPATLALRPEAMTEFKNRYQSYVRDGRLIYIGKNNVNITGVIIDNMFIQGGGGECVRLRNSTTYSTISNSIIRYCGLFAKTSGDRYAYHNGEGVYIGTSPNSTSQPQAGRDASNYNVVRDNIISTFGSECVDVKEVAAHNLIANNNCRYNLEPADSLGSNIEIRGDHNIVQYNSMSWSLGTNLKLKSNSATYDRGGNTIKGNVMTGAKSGVAIRVEQTDVRFCGNVVAGSVYFGGPAAGRSSAEVIRPCSVASADQSPLSAPAGILSR